MSITLNTKTPQKKAIAKILRSVADWIETSGNQTITIDLTLTFNKCKKAEAHD